MAKYFTFDINVPGDYVAGIPDIVDEVTVTVDSGDPGGDAESKEFAEHMTNALQEWYDSPKVELIMVEDEDGIVYEKPKDLSWFDFEFDEDDWDNQED